MRSATHLRNDLDADQSLKIERLFSELTDEIEQSFHVYFSFNAVRHSVMRISAPAWS